jgi:TonB-dependent starch-binding outer membrane protein SusC
MELMLFQVVILDEEGYSDSTPILKGTTFRMNSDAKFNDWFKAGESLQAMYIDEYGNLGDNDEGTPISNAYRVHSPLSRFMILHG